MTKDPQPPTEAQAILPTLEDILTEYRMAEISMTTAIDHIQCHIDEARTTPTSRDVLDSDLAMNERIQRIIKIERKAVLEEVLREFGELRGKCGSDYGELRRLIAKQLEKADLGI